MNQAVQKPVLLLWSLSVLVIFGILAGCTATVGQEEETGVEEENGEVSESGAVQEDEPETSEPATLESLDGAFFLCQGENGPDNTCGDLTASEGIRSFFFFRRIGELLRVYDEDTAWEGTMEGETLSLSNSFTAYLPLESLTENQKRTVVCRVRVEEGSYQFSFASEDRFSVTGSGTVVDDAATSELCASITPSLFPTGSCFHEFYLNCERTDEGLSETEILAIYEGKVNEWEKPVFFY